jgi:hypothetical protein
MARSASRNAGAADRTRDSQYGCAILRLVRGLLVVAVVPAYVLGSVLIVAVLVVGAIVGVREIRGAGETCSLAATRSCLNERGAEVRFRPGGAAHAYPALTVGPFQSVTGEPSAVMWFAPSAESARDAEWSDSEKIPRKGNVLLPVGPDNPIVHACLTEK